MRRIAFVFICKIPLISFRLCEVAALQSFFAAMHDNSLFAGVVRRGVIRRVKILTNFIRRIFNPQITSAASVAATQLLLLLR